jgi:hypothetical protein
MTEERIEKQIQDILEINRMIVKQNALLVQTLTMPKIMVSGERPGSWTEYGTDKEKNT